MQTWVVANQKGGVGKTTTVVTVGAALTQRGYRVLLVDLDPHGSLTAYFGLDPDSVDGSAYQLFMEAQQDIAGYVTPTRYPDLSLLPSSPALATLDRQLGAQTGKGMVLRQALATLRSEFDYVLVECSPTLGILMINALAAGQLLVLPVQTEHLALKGLERMLVTLSKVNKARGTPMPFLIVPTLFDRRTRASSDALVYLQEHHGKDLWELVIPVDTQFRDASKAGVPLLLSLVGARGTLAYVSLVETLMYMVGVEDAHATGKELKAYELTRGPTRGAGPLHRCVIRRRAGFSRSAPRCEGRARRGSTRLSADPGERYSARRPRRASGIGNGASGRWCRVSRRLAERVGRRRRPWCAADH